MATDEQLARGVQEGDREALALLVARHHAPLLGFLFRMAGGHHALAEDLAQEAFLRVLRSIAHYRYPRPFKPWLYAIAVNLNRDHFKRADTKYRHFMDEETMARLPDLGRPDTRLLEEEESLAVAAALLTLPEPQREVVVLRYYQELSLAEIAEALDVPLGTVKSRLHIGLGRLKERMEENDAAREWAATRTQ